MNNQPPQHVLDKINGRNFSTYKLLGLIRDTPELDIETDAGWSWLTWNGVQIEGTGEERFVHQGDIDDLLYMAIGNGFKDDVKRAVADELESLLLDAAIRDDPHVRMDAIQKRLSELR